MDNQDAVLTDKSVTIFSFLTVIVQTSPVTMRENGSPPSLLYFLHVALAELVYPDPSDIFCPSPHSSTSRSRIGRSASGNPWGTWLTRTHLPRKWNQRDDCRMKSSSLPCGYLQHGSSNHSSASATSSFHHKASRMDTGPASVHEAWKSDGFSGLFWTHTSLGIASRRMKTCWKWKVQVRLSS